MLTVELTSPVAKELEIEPSDFPTRPPMCEPELQGLSITRSPSPSSMVTDELTSPDALEPMMTPVDCPAKPPTLSPPDTSADALEPVMFPIDSPTKPPIKSPGPPWYSETTNSPLA